VNPSFDQIIQSIEQLPADEQERLRRWLEDKSAHNGEAHNSQAHASRSAKSLRWLDENREKFLGQWVALDGDRLIASGTTAQEVYSKAKAEGVAIPFVELVTERESAPFTGGMALVGETLTFDKTHYYNTLTPGISLTAILHRGQQSVECEAG
jgi:hypothetical protein